MGRLVVFFVLVIVLAQALAHAPFIGPVFARTGCLGIWVVAAGLSFGMTRLGERLVKGRRTRAEVRRLDLVGGAVNHGKAGALLLLDGSPRRALEHLRLAAEGEPGRAEWHYRLGCALLQLRRTEEALAALRTSVEIDEEYAYGAAQMRLAEALATSGDAEQALHALEVFERNHGPSPESAYRRGRLLRGLGRRAEAAACFQEVGELARTAVRYQRREAMGWSVRATLARWI